MRARGPAGTDAGDDHRAPPCPIDLRRAPADGDLPAFAQQDVPARPAEPRQARRAANYPPKMDGADVVVYKTVGDVKLNAYVFKPAGWKATDKRPAIVFFFGGGWTNGSPASFEHHCRYFAGRGMVAVAADYRVKSRHGVSPVECVADAKSAVRWLRANAATLGVDPDRIAAGGGSAGGHIAACAGVIKGFDEPGEDAAVSSRPDALVLFNPALDTSTDRFKERFGERVADLSPVAHVRAGAAADHHLPRQGRPDRPLRRRRDVHPVDDRGRQPV